LIVAKIVYVIPNHFFSEVETAIKVSDETQRIFAVNQYVGGKDFTGLEVREAKPQNMKYQGVDIAQLIFHHSVFTQYDFTGHYAGDGILIDKIFAENPEWFSYIPKELCYYNHLENTPKAKLPKILLISDKPAELKSYVAADYEDANLDTIHLTNDTNINEVLAEKKPDAIVTISDDWKNFPNLANQPLNVRNKWISFKEITQNTGQEAYQCAMETMLRMYNSQLVSYFTPIYNTG
jgi:hypothetical protein